MIFALRDPDDQLYFLLAGTARLYKIYGAYKEVTVALSTDGNVFGELSLQQRSRQNAFVEAVTAARTVASG